MESGMGMCSVKAYLIFRFERTYCIRFVWKRTLTVMQLCIIVHRIHHRDTPLWVAGREPLLVQGTAVYHCGMPGSLYSNNAG